MYLSAGLTYAPDWGHGQTAQRGYKLVRLCGPQQYECLVFANMYFEKRNMEQRILEKNDLYVLSIGK